MNSIHSTGAGRHKPVGGFSSPDDDDGDFQFWRFKDLLDRRIVSDRADLFRKQQRGFPKAVKLTKGQGAVALFSKRAVKDWLRANIDLAKAG